MIINEIIYDLQLTMCLLPSHIKFKLAHNMFSTDHLHGRPVLDWSRRKRIALGTARGLVYLHEQCDPRVIHRDVKAANILLDEDFEAVVGDFGLAKLLDHRDSHVTTAVRGTVGHIAPEYLSTGQSSEKTDVFGFGILLLELITGHKAVDFGRGTNQKGVILDWVRTPTLRYKLYWKISGPCIMYCECVNNLIMGMRLGSMYNPH